MLDQLSIPVLLLLFVVALVLAVPAAILICSALGALVLGYERFVRPCPDFRLGRMPSGKPGLTLGGECEWQGFPRRAKAAVKRFGMEVTQKIDAIDQRMWIARVGDAQFCISWDDMFREVTIMAWGDTPDSEVERLSGHNQPMQRTGAAGIVSSARRVLKPAPAADRHYVIGRNVSTLDYASPASSPNRIGAGRFVMIALPLVLAALPCGLLAGVYASFVTAALYLGRFPSYGNPDPKTLPGWVMTPYLLTFPAMFLVPGAVWLGTWRLRHRRPELMMIAPILLAVGSWVLLLTDPFGAMNWFLD